MNPLLLVVLTWLIISVIMTVFYVIQLKTKDATLVDAVWAGGLGLAAIIYSFFGTGDTGRRILLLVLAGIWSFRLAFYLVASYALNSLSPVLAGKFQVTTTVIKLIPLAMREAVAEWGMRQKLPLWALSLANKITRPFVNG